MDLVELLRSQARKYRCPVCGESMADCEIALLVQAGNQALVRVTCKACSDANLLKIEIRTGDTEDADAVFDDARDERSEPALPPVGVDDVLDAKLALDAWEGDFRSLFGETAAS
jgi:transcription elongation factor Elf1